MVGWNRQISAVSAPMSSGAVTVTVLSRLPSACTTSLSSLPLPRPTRPDLLRTCGRPIGRGAGGRVGRRSEGRGEVACRPCVGLLGGGCGAQQVRPVGAVRAGDGAEPRRQGADAVLHA